MKKQLHIKLFSLTAMLVVSVSAAFAADVEYQFNSFTSATSVSFKTDNDNLTITLAKGNGGSDPAWNKNSSEARLYAKGTLTVKSETKKIASIVYTYRINANKSGKTPTIDSVKGSTSDGTWNSETTTWTGSDTEVVFSTGGDAGNFGFTKIEVTYAAGDEPTPTDVEAPVLTPGSGTVDYGSSVTIENINEDYMYFYTIDESTPDCDEELNALGTSIVYSNGITINGDVTIKIIAADIEGNKSSTVTAKYTVARPETPYLSVAPGAVDEGTVVNITAPQDDYVYFYTDDETEPVVVDLEAQGTTKKFPSGGVEINETTTLKVVAVDVNGLMSDVKTAKYTVVKIEDGVFDFVSKAFDYGSGVETTSNEQEYISDEKTWTAGNVTLVTAGKYRWWNNDGTLRFYKNDSNQSKMTISVPNGYVITEIAVTGGQQFASDDNNYKASTGKWTGEAQSVVLTYASASSKSVNVKTVTVTYEEAPAPATVSVSVGEAGAATFSSDKALDFTDVEEIQAYIATVSGNSITFTRVNKVPANTGLLLRNAKGVAEGAVEPVDVPVLADEPEEFGENALVAVAEEIASLATEETGSQYVNYILNNNDGNLGFYRAAGKKVAAGKAYLKVEKTVAQSREFISIDDTATSIGKLNVQNAGQTIYDLQGRRVQNPVRGLYIIGNRKVVVK